MSIVAWIIVGLFAGLAAKSLMPGNEPGGVFVTILLGIAGAFVAGLVAVTLGISDGVNNFDAGTFAIAIFGAMLLLVGFRSVFGSRATV